MINFEVTSQNIKLISKPSRDIVDNQLNFLICSFKFSSEWSDLNKVIQFKQKDQIVNIYVGPVNEAQVNFPSEIHHGDLFISCMGYLKVENGEIYNPETGDTAILYSTLKRAETNKYYLPIVHTGYDSTNDCDGDPDRRPENVGDKSYIHNQEVPDKHWGIKHNLHKFPSVTVQDSSGKTVIGEVQYVDLNNIILLFSKEIKGRAMLN